MNKKRVWLVSEVFYPDTDIATANIATEIALKFRENFEVHVICGPSGYERKKNDTVDDQLEGIYIHRWKYFNYNKNHKIKRLVRVGGISLGLFLYGFKIRKEDKAFVISNPAFITPFFALLKRLKGFQYTLLMHDVFPENLVAGGYINGKAIFYNITKWFFAKSRTAADKIIVIGRDMKQLLLDRFPPSRERDIVVIPNWADTDTVFPLEQQDKALEQLKLKSKIVILFAGNHGVLQNLLSFIKIIGSIHNEYIHCVFAGGGAAKRELEDYVLANNMSNITFLPPFSRTENNDILNSCHIGLVSLTDSLYGVGVPSKSYNILSAGKPILFLGNTKTEIAQLVKENEIGWTFEYKNRDEIITFLNSLTPSGLTDIRQKGKKARALVVKEYDRLAILNRILYQLNC